MCVTGTLHWYICYLPLLWHPSMSTRHRTRARELEAPEVHAVAPETFFEQPSPAPFPLHDNHYSSSDNDDATDEAVRRYHVKPRRDLRHVDRPLPPVAYAPRSFYPQPLPQHLADGNTIWDGVSEDPFWDPSVALELLKEHSVAFRSIGLSLHIHKLTYAGGMLNTIKHKVKVAQAAATAALNTHLDLLHQYNVWKQAYPKRKRAVRPPVEIDEEEQRFVRENADGKAPLQAALLDAFIASRSTTELRSRLHTIAWICADAGWTSVLEQYVVHTLEKERHVLGQAYAKLKAPTKDFMPSDTPSEQTLLERLNPRQHQHVLDVQKHMTRENLEAYHAAMDSRNLPAPVPYKKAFVEAVAQARGMKTQMQYRAALEERLEAFGDLLQFELQATEQQRLRNSFERRIPDTKFEPNSENTAMYTPTRIGSDFDPPLVYLCDATLFPDDYENWYNRYLHVKGSTANHTLAALQRQVLPMDGLHPVFVAAEPHMLAQKREHSHWAEQYPDALHAHQRRLDLHHQFLGGYFDNVPGRYPQLYAQEPF